MYAESTKQVEARGDSMNGKWSCEKCGKLLGTLAEGRVTFRIRKSQYTAAAGEGTALVQAICPKCSRLNELKVVSIAMDKTAKQ